MAPHSISLTGLFIMLWLYRPLAAQLSSCDAIKCPLDQYSNPTCSVGNVTARAIGIANFSIPLSSHALTWTVAVQSLSDGQSTFERDFFLGTPPDLNLTTLGSLGTHVCAIFFNGAANQASFPGEDPEHNQGTCNDALTAGCVNDIRNQAQAFRLKEHNSTNNNTSFCTELGKALSMDAPPSCIVAAGDEWSDVQARTLTGFDAPKSIQKGDCTPTTGKDYELMQTESIRIVSPSRNYTDLKPILYGVTPILTAVWDERNGTVMSSELSCLKTVGAARNATIKIQKGGSERVTADTSFGLGFLGMWCLAVWFFML